MDICFKFQAGNCTSSNCKYKHILIDEITKPYKNLVSLQDEINYSNAQKDSEIQHYKNQLYYQNLEILKVVQKIQSLEYLNITNNNIRVEHVNKINGLENSLTQRNKEFISLQIEIATYAKKLTEFKHMQKYKEIYEMEKKISDKLGNELGKVKKELNEIKEKQNEPQNKTKIELSKIKSEWNKNKEELHKIKAEFDRSKIQLHTTTEELEKVKAQLTLKSTLLEESKVQLEVIENQSDRFAERYKKSKDALEAERGKYNQLEQKYYQILNQTDDINKKELGLVKIELQKALADSNRVGNSALNVVEKIKKEKEDVESRFGHYKWIAENETKVEYDLYKVLSTLGLLHHLPKFITEEISYKTLQLLEINDLKDLGLNYESAISLYNNLHLI